MKDYPISTVTFGSIFYLDIFLGVMERQNQEPESLKKANFYLRRYFDNACRATNGKLYRTLLFFWITSLTGRLRAWATASGVETYDMNIDFVQP